MLRLVPLISLLLSTTSIASPADIEFMYRDVGSTSRVAVPSETGQPSLGDISLLLEGVDILRTGVGGSLSFSISNATRPEFGVTGYPGATVAGNLVTLPSATPGTYSLALTASEGDRRATATKSIRVLDGLHVVPPLALPSVRVGQTTELSGEAYGVAGVPTWSITGGALEIDPGTGTFKVSPTSVGTISGVVLSVRDSLDGASASSTPFDVTSVAALSISLPSPVGSIRVGRSAQIALQSEGLVGSPTWSVSGSDRVAIHPETGAITVAPLAVGEIGPVSILLVDDHDDASDTRSLVVPVVAALGVDPIVPPSVVRPGVTTDLQAVATGLLGQPSWSANGNAAVTVDASSGLVSVLPTEVGRMEDITVSVTDGADSETASTSFSLDVVAEPIRMSLSASTLVSNVATSVPVVPVGGFGPLSVEAVTLPTGATLSADGRTISARLPTGVHPLHLRVSDGHGTEPFDLRTDLVAEPAEGTEVSAFSVKDVTGGRPNFLVQTESVQVSGFRGAAVISASGAGRISVEGGPFVQSATIRAGQSFVPAVQSGTHGTTTETTIAVGDRSDVLTVSTVAPIAVEPNNATPHANNMERSAGRSPTSTSGGFGTLSWRVVGGQLPEGYAINSRGGFTGIGQKLEKGSVTIRTEDEAGGFVDTTWNWEINGIRATATSRRTMIVNGTPYATGTSDLRYCHGVEPQRCTAKTSPDLGIVSTIEVEYAKPMHFVAANFGWIVTTAPPQGQSRSVPFVAEYFDGSWKPFVSGDLYGSQSPNPGYVNGTRFRFTFDTTVQTKVHGMIDLHTLW